MRIKEIDFIKSFSMYLIVTGHAGGGQWSMV